MNRWKQTLAGLLAVAILCGSLPCQTLAADVDAADQSTTEEDAVSASAVEAEESGAAASESETVSEDASAIEAELSEEAEADQETESADEAVTVSEEDAEASDDADAEAEVEEELVYDLDGLLVSDNGEEDMNSWRYEDGELIEAESEDSNDGIMIVDIDSSDSVAFGIDVSKWQGDIDWDSARGSISFAIIRCGYGSNLTSNDDSYFEQNVAACEELGIPYGVYLYSYATTTTEAKSEANHVLRLLDGHTPSLPVYLDLEDSSVTSACSNSQILAMAKVFCNAIEDAGYEAGVYANKNWWTNYLTSSTYDQWDRWVAQYNTSCTYTGGGLLLLAVQQHRLCQQHFR